MKFKIFLAIIFIISSNCFADTKSWHFIPPDVTALHSKPADVKISYGKDPLQFAELRLPEKSGMHPVEKFKEYGQIIRIVL